MNNWQNATEPIWMYCCLRDSRWKKNPAAHCIWSKRKKTRIGQQNLTADVSKKSRPADNGHTTGYQPIWVLVWYWKEEEEEKELVFFGTKKSTKRISAPNFFPIIIITRMPPVGFLFSGIFRHIGNFPFPFLQKIFPFTGCCSNFIHNFEIFQAHFCWNE